MKATNATVFIIDDDASVLRGLKRLFRSNGYHAKAFESADTFFKKKFRPEGPACLVLDMRMPELNGFDVQEIIARKTNILPIVFITAHGDIPMSVQAIKRGAIDFLSKPFDEKDLLKAVSEALKKSSSDLERQEEVRQIHQPIQRLTPREYEILTYVITGLLNKQIAYALDISEKTVKVHRGRVMDKLDVDSVPELVRLAEKAGVMPAEVSI